MAIGGEILFQPICVDVHSIGFLHFILLNSLFEVGNGLLLRVHGLGHALDERLLALGGSLQALIVLVLYHAVLHRLVVVPALVFV